ncbi:MAG: GntR family transcriptional regulator [Planctomycetes bacterium]|jgi:DNA-binding LacI/PurR family transcriptional regulator|nr:GntR family transcriptional regulator [Planctomycetota bacterium]
MAEPVYPIIKEKIEQAIRDGEWSHRLPSAFKLAKRFGASHLTVLKAIKMLKEDGKLVVQERQGTFIANGGPTRRVSPYVGVIGFAEDADIPRRSQEQYFLQAIKNYLEAHGFRMLAIQHFDESDAHFAQTLTDISVSGYLFTSSMLTQDLADKLKLAGVPFVSLTRIDRIDGIACVDFNHEESLKCLLRHYIACGHKRIAMARRQAPFLLTYSEKGLQAYRETLEAAGIYDPGLLHIFNNELIFRFPQDPHAAAEIAEEMFKQYYCCENPPTAIHINSSALARVFLAKIRKDAPQWANSLALSTSVGSPPQDALFRSDFCCTLLGDYAELARTGVEMLAARVADPGAAVKKIEVPMSLHIHRKVVPQPPGVVQVDRTA